MADNHITRKPISSLTPLRKESMLENTIMYVSLANEASDGEPGRDRKISISDLFWAILGYGNTPFLSSNLNNNTYLQISYNGPDGIISNRATVGEIVKYITGPRSAGSVSNNDCISVSRGNGDLSNRVLLTFQDFKNSITDLNVLRVINDFEVTGEALFNKVEVTDQLKVSSVDKLVIGTKTLNELLTTAGATPSDATITIKKNSSDAGQSFTLNQSAAKTIDLNIQGPQPIKNGSGTNVWDGSAPYTLDYADIKDTPVIGTGVLDINVSNADGTSSSVSFGANSAVNKSLNITIPPPNDLNGTGFVKMSGSTPSYKTTIDYATEVSNKPNIPTVNNSTITIKANGSTQGSFTTNQASNSEIDIQVVGGGGGGGGGIVISRRDLFPAVGDPSKLYVPTDEKKIYRWADGTSLNYTWALADFIDISIERFGNDPFFIMAEGAQIDWECHANNLIGAIYETEDLDKAVQRAVAFYNSKPNETLIVVCSDHGCGGPHLIPGPVLDASWDSTDHTAELTPVYAIGVGQNNFSGNYSNTDLFNKIKSSFTGTQLKYVFLFIGDGMGDVIITATEQHVGHQLTFAGFPVHGTTENSPNGGGITDSAAAATAIACGFKTNNNWVGTDPAGVSLTPLPLHLRTLNLIQKVAIVTSCSIDHATPAGFYATTAAGDPPLTRTEYERIVDPWIWNRNYDIYASSGLLAMGNYYNLVNSNGYRLVGDRTQLAAAPAGSKLFIREGNGTGALIRAIDRSGFAGEYINIIGVNDKNAIIKVDGVEKLRYNASNYTQYQDSIMNIDTTDDELMNVIIDGFNKINEALTGTP